MRGEVPFSTDLGGRRFALFVLKPQTMRSGQTGAARLFHRPRERERQLKNKARLARAFHRLNEVKEVDRRRPNAYRRLVFLSKNLSSC